MEERDDRYLFESIGFQYPAWPPTWASTCIHDSYHRHFPQMETRSLLNTAHNHSDDGSVTRNDTTRFPNSPVINVPASSESKRVSNEPLEESGNTFLKREDDDILG